MWVQPSPGPGNSSEVQEKDQGAGPPPRSFLTVLGKASDLSGRYLRRRVLGERVFSLPWGRSYRNP